MYSRRLSSQRLSNCLTLPTQKMDSHDQERVQQTFFVTNRWTTMDLSRLTKGGIWTNQKTKRETRRKEQLRRQYIGLYESESTGIIISDSNQETFRSFDQNGDGVITAREFRSAVAKLGQNLSDAEVAEFLRSVDKDGDGVISYEEFAKYVVSNM
ncbi:hypothetical protein Btru_029596 [Bulinus truncatus]|nr:hypothetical protein Btru_029596 [Bulinus truncatus]